jgi:hypothetical protein
VMLCGTSMRHGTALGETIGLSPRPLMRDRFAAGSIAGGHDPSARVGRNSKAGAIPSSQPGQHRAPFRAFEKKPAAAVAVLPAPPQRSILTFKGIAFRIDETTDEAVPVVGSNQAMVADEVNLLVGYQAPSSRAPPYHAPPERSSARVSVPAQTGLRPQQGHLCRPQQLGPPGPKLSSKLTARRSGGIQRGDKGPVGLRSVCLLVCCSCSQPTFQHTSLASY